MSGDRLAQIEAREVGTGPRFLTLWEQSALVEIAKAARLAAELDVAEQTVTSETWLEPRGMKQNLRSALARLDSGAAEEDA